MKIKKGDQVKVMVGKSRGKTGKVLRILAERNKIVVEGANLLVKHLRPRQEKEKGQRVQFPAPLPVSNVKLVCPKCGKATRIGYKRVASADGANKNFRVCKKCLSEI